MPLDTGTRFGPYEILTPIGAGGMGEVYRAKDTRLKREVALKVLPESFARDRERMDRFQREAEVLASLNHPCLRTPASRNTPRQVLIPAATVDISSTHQFYRGACNGQTQLRRELV